MKSSPATVAHGIHIHIMDFLHGFRFPGSCTMWIFYGASCTDDFADLKDFLHQPEVCDLFQLLIDLELFF